MIVNWIGALFVLGVFIYLLTVFRVVATSREVLSLSAEAMSTLNNRNLSDLEKEKAMQAFSLRLFRSFFLIVIGSALALLLPCSAIWLLDLLQWVSLEAIVATSLSWPFIAASLVIGCGAFYLMQKRTG